MELIDLLELEIDDLVYLEFVLQEPKDYLP